MPEKTDHQNGREEKLSKAGGLWRCFNAAAGLAVGAGVVSSAYLAVNGTPGAGLGALLLTVMGVPAAAVAIQSGMKRAWPDIADEISRMPFGTRYYWGMAFAAGLVGTAAVADDLYRKELENQPSPAAKTQQAPAFGPITPRKP